jgi:uncharacterized Rmd1/YagE family protein
LCVQAGAAADGRLPTRPVSVFCLAEGFDLKALKARAPSACRRGAGLPPPRSAGAPARPHTLTLVRSRAPLPRPFSHAHQQRNLKAPWAGRLERVDADVAYLPFVLPDSSSSESAESSGDVFIFDYGVAACWGLTAAQEDAVLASLLDAPLVAVGTLPPGLRERDAFEVAFAPGLAPPGAASSKALCSILNGVITLDARFEADSLAQLAVSHAIAQSTKLCVFETRVTRLAEACAHIPSALAAAGEVRMPRREATRLTGQLFLQRSAVNLLSTVLDVPEFFWDAADELQGVYSSVTKYLELKNRVTVLNARYQVLEAMLTMVQAQLNEHHASRLEWIIMCVACATARAACVPCVC